MWTEDWYAEEVRKLLNDSPTDSEKVNIDLSAAAIKHRSAGWIDICGLWIVDCGLTFVIILSLELIDLKKQAFWMQSLLWTCKRNVHFTEQSYT